MTNAHAVGQGGWYAVAKLINLARSPNYDDPCLHGISASYRAREIAGAVRRDRASFAIPALLGLGLGRLFFERPTPAQVVQQFMTAGDPWTSGVVFPKQIVHGMRPCFMGRGGQLKWTPFLPGRRGRQPYEDESDRLHSSSDFSGWRLASLRRGKSAYCRFLEPIEDWWDGGFHAGVGSGSIGYLAWERFLSAGAGKVSRCCDF
jgi:hypothetical protein